MLYFFHGTDTDALKEALQAALNKVVKGSTVVRITDAHTKADLEASLQGGGLFGEKRVVVFTNIYENLELRDVLHAQIPRLSKSEELFFMTEGGLDAATRKTIEKYATESKRLDLPSGRQAPNTIFDLANALQSGNKKDLWVGYQRELQGGKAPEAIHGVLFWAAKQYCLRTGSDRSRNLVARLAELPHEARRQGEELEYALERFVLSGA